MKTFFTLLFYLISRSGSRSWGMLLNIVFSPKSCVDIHNTLNMAANVAKVYGK